MYTQNNFCFVDFKQEFINDIDLLRAKLSGIKEGDILVLNFLRFYDHTSEVDLLQCFSNLFSILHDFNTIFINVDCRKKYLPLKELYNTTFSKENMKSIPIFDSYGDLIAFLGITNKIVLKQLSELFSGKDLHPIELERLNKESSDSILEIMSMNEWLFQKPPKGSNYWKSKIIKKDLFAYEIKNEIFAIDAYITNSHVELLSGKHTSEYILSDRIIKCQKLPMRLAKQMYSRVKNNIEFDTISTFSFLGLHFAQAFSDEIYRKENKDMDVICLENYDNLTVQASFTEDFSDRKVFILLNMNNSGCLLNKIVNFWEKENDSRVVGIGVAIDTGNYSGYLRNHDYHSLCSWKIPIYDRDDCPICQAEKDTLLYVDEEILTTREYKQEMQESHKLSELMDKNPKIIKFWEGMDSTDALFWHVNIKTKDYLNRHYLEFIDVEKLLRNDSIKKDIIRRILNHYKKRAMAEPGNNYKDMFPFDLIVCAPNQNSVTIAQELERHIEAEYGIEIKSIDVVGDGNGYRFSYKSELAQLEKASKILIIDDGTNTGETIFGIRTLLLSHGKNKYDIEACVFIDRLTGISSNAIKRAFSGDERYYYVYKIEIPAYVKHSGRCPYCREIETMKKDISRYDSPLVKQYCSDRIEKIEITDLPSKEVHSNVQKSSRLTSYKGVSLRYNYFIAFVSDIISKVVKPISMIDFLEDIEDEDIIVAVIEAINTIGMTRQLWFRYFDEFYAIGDNLKSFEIKKTILNKIALQGLITDDIKNIIMSFIETYIEDKLQLPFLAWLTNKVGDSKIKDFLIESSKRHKNTVRENYKQIIESLMPVNIIAESPQMKSILQRIEKVASTDATVLFTGESGTGKTILAKELHSKSNRSRFPFKDINCGSIAENLIESEMFGHVKGAFTGAVNDKKGKFEQADKGTLFLDEIGEMTPALQVKLLKAIEQKEFEPVGGEKTVKVDVRILAATHRNIDELVENGKFREDLSYRLKVIEIHIPPLRERIADLKVLIDHQFEKYNKQYNKKISIDNDARKALETYNWPGNIRELENIILGICLLAEQNTVTINDLPDKVVNFRKIDDDGSDLINNSDVFRYEGDLNDRQLKAIDLMLKKKKRITNSDYRNINGNINRETTRQDINELILKNICQKSGKGRSIKYQLTDNFLKSLNH